MQTNSIPIKIPAGAAAIGAAPVLHFPQCQSNWCWAACMKMGLSSFGLTAKQCELAGKAFGVSTCCQDGSSQDCNKPLPIMQVAVEWSNRSCTCDFVSGPLTYEQLSAALDKAGFVECGLSWNDGGGHAILVTAVESVADRTVTILDPLKRKSGSYSFSDLTSAYGLGRWRWTWKDFNHNAV